MSISTLKIKKNDCKLNWNLRIKSDFVLFFVVTNQSVIKSTSSEYTFGFSLQNIDTNCLLIARESHQRLKVQ
jgi:hypothetical protein